MANQTVTLPAPLAVGDTLTITVAAPNPWSVPFGSRPSGKAQVISNAKSPVVSGESFTGMGQVALVFQNCASPTVTACDFETVLGGIFFLNCTNPSVTWCRYHEVGDGTIGSGHSNFVQLNACTGGYIGDVKGRGGKTEDIISLYKSSGADASHLIIVERFAFEGTDWTSTSGSGVMTGDAGGSHIIVRNGTLLTPGQVGIGIVGGADIHVMDNVLYGAQRPQANVGLSCYNPSASKPFGPHQWMGNRVWWENAAGHANPQWVDPAVSAALTQVGNVWQDTTIDPTKLAVTL